MIGGDRRGSMTSTHCFRVLLAAVIVLCVAGAAALFLLPPPQAEGEPIVSFETIPSEEIPAVVDAALTPDPHLTPGYANETANETENRSPDISPVKKMVMDDSEDDIPLTEDTDIPGFAWDQMKRWGCFQKELEGCKAGEMIYVHSLNGWRDYYLIPFEKDGTTRVIASVSIKNNGTVADFGGCVGLPSDYSGSFRFLPSREEALKALDEKEYQGVIPEHPRVVWKACVQSWSKFHPFWEFETTTGKTVYVGYDRTGIQVYDELTRPTRGGGG